MKDREMVRYVEGGKEMGKGMKETQRRRITFTSSLISTDQLGIRVWGRCYSGPFPLLSTADFWTDI
jgi:hypothetical protein